MSIETNIEVQLTNRDRRSAFFRIILVLPIAIWAATLAPSSLSNTGNVMSGIGFLTLSVALSLLFMGIYPSYLLTFNHALLELHTRISAYVLLLTDRYPSIEGNDEISVIFPEIQGGATLNRGKAIIKWLLAIPAYLVGILYALIALLLTFAGWFSILFTGNLPEFAGKFIYATITYWNDIFAYAFVLVTDEYPVFSLNLS